MIQRIQSVWLFLAALSAVLTYKFSFYSGQTGTGFKELVASSNFILLITTGVLIAGCVFVIFLYKNRKQQLWLTIGAALLSVINIIIYFGQTKNFIPHQSNYNLSSIFSFIIPVFLFLAARGIWKDEKLVKSLDRLR